MIVCVFSSLPALAAPRRTICCERWKLSCQRRRIYRQSRTSAQGEEAGAANLIAPPLIFARRTEARRPAGEASGRTDGLILLVRRPLVVGSAASVRLVIQVWLLMKCDQAFNNGIASQLATAIFARARNLWQNTRSQVCLAGLIGQHTTLTSAAHIFRSEKK